MAWWKKLFFTEKNMSPIDRIGLKDNMGIKRTEVIIKDSVTGEELFRGHNSVIIPGSIFTAKCHFPDIQIANCNSYNSILNLAYTIGDEKRGTQQEQIWLFCVGTDGAEIESTQIKPVVKTKFIHKDYLVPFRYVDDINDASIDRNHYFGRKEVLDKRKVAYYFKTFTDYPIAYVKYADGTSINTDMERMWESTNIDPQVMVEIQFKVTPEDCREWFKATSSGGLADARVNTISLCSAWKCVNPDDGYTYYQNIQPVTKLNFTTEPLYDDTKGLDIIYHLYY